MIKQLFTLALPMAMSLTAQASAFDSLEMQQLQEQALTTLRAKAENNEIKLRGDVHAHEKLSDLLKDIDVYTNELLEYLATGEDIEKMSGPVKGVETKCALRGERIATCGVMITYRPVGETYIEFTAYLNDAGKVVATGDVADVSRGD